VIVRAVGCEEVFCEGASGFEELFVVEEDECLEGSGGDLAAGDADLAFGGVEGFHGGGWGGAFPVGVETAAVETVAVVAVVGPAAAFFLPDAWWLIGFDAGAAGFCDEEAGGGEGGVADHFCGEAEAGAAGEGDVVRVGEEAVAVAAAFLGEGSAEGDGAEEAFDVPARGDEVAGEGVEEIRVGGERALIAEVIDGVDETAAEHLGPETVDDDASGERVGGVGGPFGETEAIGWVSGVEGEDGGGDACGDGIAGGVVSAALEEAGGFGVRGFLHDHEGGDGVLEGVEGGAGLLECGGGGAGFGVEGAEPVGEECVGCGGGGESG
jgi:hypothetical protein